MHLTHRLSGRGLVLLGATLAGCSDSVGVRDADIEPALAAISVAPAEANGTGEIDLTSAGAGFAEFYLRTKRQLGPGGGKITGNFRQVRSNAGGTIDFSGRVVCLAVDAVNHRAWIGAVVTQNNSTNPLFQTAIHQVGKDVWFRVVDYATASPAQPDRSTVLGFEGSAGFITSEQYCKGQPWPGPPIDVVDARTFPITVGGIVITP